LGLLSTLFFFLYLCLGLLNEFVLNVSSQVLDRFDRLVKNANIMLVRKLVFLDEGEQILKELIQDLELVPSSHLH